MRLLFYIIFISTALFAQQKENLNSFVFEPTESNISSKIIYSDENSTSILILIRDGVRPHKHVYHTETIYVLAGIGMMKIGSKSMIVSEGDFFVIPKNTVHSVQVISSAPLKVLSVQAPKFEGKDRVFVD